MTFQNSKTDCQGVGLQAICNVDVPEFRLLSLPPPPGRTGGGGACVFASLFSSVKVLYGRVRALSLRSLTRPGPRSSRSRSLPRTPPLPASCLDQWVTCMSNSPLEHTRRPARTRSKTHTYANTVIIFKVHSSTGMRFHVPLRKHTRMRVTLRVPGWQMLRFGLLACLYRRVTEGFDTEPKAVVTWQLKSQAINRVETYLPCHLSGACRGSS